MRFHIWMFLNDEDGKPVPGADVSVFLAGTDIPATIYTSEFSSDTINTAPHLKTNSMGYFEFWIGDTYETEGYPSNQKFKLYFEKIGIIEGYIDYVDVFPGYIEVDEFDIDPLKNKTVSNRLAFLWETHRLDVSHLVHGIEEVDETDDSTKRNKLVSNKLIKDIKDKLDFSFDGEWDNENDPFGLQKVDPNSLDEKYNKLMNNALAYYWQEHINKIIKEGITPDELEVHGLKIVDPQKTDDVFNKLVSNEFMRNIYILLNQSLRVKEISIYEDEWTYYRELNLFKIRIFHNLKTISPLVHCYLDNKTIMPKDIEVINDVSFDLVMPIAADLNVNVSGKGQQLKV